MSEERREHPRDYIKNTQYCCTVIVNPHRELATKLLDISAFGARLGLSPDEIPPPAGSEVVFNDNSNLAIYLDKRPATVMWRRYEQFGVRFAEQIALPHENVTEICSGAPSEPC